MEVQQLLRTTLFLIEENTHRNFLMHSLSVVEDSNNII